MTQIFISHSLKNAHCVEQIRKELEAAGYDTWKDSQDINPGDPSYVRAIETGIRGSAATIIIWSKDAAESEWVEREILFSQQLKKPIFPVIIDGTELGILLVSLQAVKSDALCEGAVKKLLPHLSPPNSEDEFQKIAKLLAHDHIRKRKYSVELAEKLLEQDKHREEILALLEDVARKDLMIGVREAARKVIDADTQKDTPPEKPDESRHIFKVRCPNGHICYFDRRIVCPDSGKFKRSIVRRGGKSLDDIILTCEECGKEMVVPVNCEDYK